MRQLVGVYAYADVPGAGRPRIGSGGGAGCPACLHADGRLLARVWVEPRVGLDGGKDGRGPVARGNADAGAIP